MNPLAISATNDLSRFVEDLTLVRIPPWWQSPGFIVLALAGLAALVFGGFRLYVRFQRAAPAGGHGAIVPAEAAHLWALRELEELKRKQAQLGPYQLAIACSRVLRRYIEARFRLPILYQTTREFLGHAQTHAALGESGRSSLGEYLRLCDRVKFARHGASDAEVARMVDFAIDFVKAAATAARAAVDGVSA